MLSFIITIHRRKAMTLKSFNTRYMKLIRQMIAMCAGLVAAVSLLSFAHWPVGAAAPLFVEKQKLIASDGVAFANFGSAIAASGSIVVVGAELDNSAHGSAYVFERQGGGWVETQKLTPSDVSRQFSHSVAVSGSTILVGAPLNNISSNPLQGEVFVFERRGGSWVETQKLTASDGDRADFFGNSVAISGSTIVVGAFGDDLFKGSVYIFERRGGNWVETQKLTASDGGRDDFFGRSVAMSGSTIIVGAPFGTLSQGSVYVFERRAGSWVETQKLTPSDGAPVIFFGDPIAISGSTIVVGIQSDLVDPRPVYVFERRGGSWVETQKLTASEGVDSHNFFGVAVAVSGSTIVVGAPRFDVDKVDQGAVFVFNRRGGSWVETQMLSASDAMVQDNFGLAVALSASTVSIGAPSADIDGKINQGAAYIFEP
jgi:uncharacterized protein (DUF2345 family)